eukprot:TRINITY_DN27935_c0_g1_i1.p1 TRINITY_DN27935_c0_g1~~TRINITY_DN27935_c0_g1_i1.p1  ORF type:complete len:191 (-),score=42.17 TRINITY_DN27935_c0_g1_i1:147-719(-)
MRREKEKKVKTYEFFFFQAEDGIRDAQESRGLGDVYKRQVQSHTIVSSAQGVPGGGHHYGHNNVRSEPTSRPSPSYDPYPGTRGPQSTEDADMALARRLQEEEDSRAGRHLQETQLGGQRPQQPQPARTQQPARAVSNTPATTTHTNQEDEDMRLAMELQRQFDDADGTDNTTVATVSYTHLTLPTKRIV